eukprot:COSAG01_NODE_49032_length_375_cov_3.420290_1_plen_47_part_10
MKDTGAMSSAPGEDVQEHRRFAAAVVRCGADWSRLAAEMGCSKATAK